MTHSNPAMPSHRKLPCLVLTALLAGCQTATPGTCPACQQVVDATARQHADLTRLTVHRELTPSGGYLAVASTAAERRGKPSDPEDLEAIRTGQTIVLDAPGVLDVTVPVMPMRGRFTAAIGVTLKLEADAVREAMVNKARDIAAAVSTAIVAGN